MDCGEELDKMSEDHEKMRRHLGYGKLEVMGQDGVADTFRLRIPTFAIMPDLFMVGTALGGEELDEEEVAEKLKGMDKENWEAINRIVKNVLDSTFPEATEDEKQSFATRHYMDILTAAIESIDFDSMSGDRKALAQVNKLKKQAKKHGKG